MEYLFFQIWGWVLASFLIGWFACWFMCVRGADSKTDKNADSNHTKPQTVSSAEPIESSTAD